MTHLDALAAYRRILAAHPGLERLGSRTVPVSPLILRNLMMKLGRDGAMQECQRLCPGEIGEALAAKIASVP